MKMKHFDIHVEHHTVPSGVLFRFSTDGKGNYAIELKRRTIHISDVKRVAAYFTKDVQASLKTLDILINDLRELDSEMQIQQIATLLAIAQDEGIALSEIAERTQQGMSSASRNVAALSTMHRKGKKGHGLVVNKEDPLERRRKQHFLTPKGVTFLRRLVDRL